MAASKNMKMLLYSLKDDHHWWKICRDLKVKYKLIFFFFCCDIQTQLLFFFSKVNSIFLSSCIPNLRYARKLYQTYFLLFMEKSSRWKSLRNVNGDFSKLFNQFLKWLLNLYSIPINFYFFISNSDCWKMLSKL